MRKLFENKLALVAMLLFTLALAWNYTHGGVALKGSHLSAAPAAVQIAHAPPMPPCDPCSVSVQIAHAPPMPPCDPCSVSVQIAHAPPMPPCDPCSVRVRISA